MRARITCCLAVLWTTTLIADDVPPPPAAIPPSAIFGQDSSGALPPSVVYPNPQPITPSNSGSSAVWWRPTTYYSYPAGSSGGAREFPFGGMVLGASIACDGSTDTMFRIGSLFEIEVGYQWLLDDGPIDAYAVSIGYVNQTLFPTDNLNVIDAAGNTYGLGNLSINTVKLGAYGGRTMGNFDFYLGGYMKLGASLLDEDFEFITPGHEIVVVQDLRKDYFTGGIGVEGAICLAQTERTSLALVAGCEYLFLNNIQGPGIDEWTFFTNVGIEYTIDITDGLFGGRNRDRLSRRERRRMRRTGSPF